jgi:hypothetical protein
MYCEMHLNLRRPAIRRLPKRDRVPLYATQHPDTVWSADFMPDALACGPPFRIFNVIDDFNRELRPYRCRYVDHLGPPGADLRAYRPGTTVAAGVARGQRSGASGRSLRAMGQGSG